MRRPLHTYYIVCMVLVALSSCTAHKFLPEGERYYDGAHFEIQTNEAIPKNDIKDTRADVERVFNITPSQRFLGMRPGVWFYHIAGDVQKEKGFKYWLKYKIGKAPVYFSKLDIPLTRELVQNRLEVNGFFQHRVTYQIDSTSHKASITYTGEVGQPYRLDTIAPFRKDSLEVINAITSVEDKTLLATGQRYDFERFQRERIRIEEELRNLGYYFFDDRNIIYEADTTLGNRLVNVYPMLKPDISAQGQKKYTVREVNVHADYDWSGKDSVVVSDTLDVLGMRYMRSREAFRPEIIASNIALRPGQLYSRENELITLNRLIQLDAFRYVNVNFTEVGPNLMDANVFLSPLKSKSIRVNVDAVTTSNNYVGPHITVSWLNRNLFKGAERFQLNIFTGYEWQLGGGGDESLNNYEFGVENVLTVPRLIQPFNIRYESSRYIPETKFKLGAKFQRRVGFYQLNSIHADYGFEWKKVATKRHKLYPIVLNYIDLGNTTPEFDSLLMENPTLARSFEEQFIVGGSYSFYFSSQEDQSNKNKTHNFYFNGNLDVSGNLMEMMFNVTGASPNSETGNFTLFGQPFSQFVRTSVDFRHYWNVSKESRIVSRFIAGLGYSYGNSITMPYSYQYSVGGSNSLRGFRARSVGPGSYVPDSTVTFIDQTGDIKLEANIEYRFPIVGAFKGALFTDMGNVWTLREEEERPGGKFKWNNVLDQLAINVGLGVRYDLKIFVIRLDVGWPVKLAYPLLDENGRETNFPIRIWESGWRREYMVWNIAIGYPF